jgi:hypothetical protein
VQHLNHFGARGLKTPNHYFAHPLEKFVTKGEIVVAGLSKNCSIEQNSRGWLGGSCIVVPQIGREQPRPSQGFSRGNDIRRNRPVIEKRALKSNRSTFNQIKTVRFFACSKDYLAASELHERRAPGNEFDVMGTHSRQEWMSGDARGQVFGFRFHGDAFLTTSEVSLRRIFTKPVYT